MASHLANDGPAPEAPLSEQSADPSSAPPGPVVAAVAGLAAAWIGGGSAGLLGYPLRHALVWLLVGGAVVCDWPGWPRALLCLLAMLGAGLAASLGTIAGLSVIGVWAVAVVLAVLSLGRRGSSRSTLLAASVAVAVLGVFQFARLSLPSLWQLADAAGRAVGRAAGWVAGRPLWVGATFGGLDFLVTMLALYALWLIHTARPRLRRAAFGLLAILTAHLLYLLALACAPAFLENAAGPSPEGGVASTPVLRKLLPWNLPLLACVAHALVAAAMFRWAAWPSESEPAAPPPRLRLPVLLAGGVLAAALPVLTVLAWHKPDLSGKKFVLYEKGFLNWLKPEYAERPENDEYGHLTVGMYGLLPTYIRSLGAECVISADLSEQDLEDADVVVLLYPTEPWQEGQLGRLWDFARRGGSLVVFGEHTVRHSDGGNRFNEVLAPTAMSVRFDSALFAVGGWLQSYEPLAHPSSAGVADDRNQFGVVTGASVAARWPARPFLVGKWGWADPGDEGSAAAMMGNDRYDPGERLGDLILAAEQSFGKGRIVTFGDTSSMANGITVGSYVYTSRLLAYLADGRGAAEALWRQLLALLATLALVFLLGWRTAALRIVGIAVPLAVSLYACTLATRRAYTVYPDGRPKKPGQLNNLAYVDASHLGLDSSEAWRPDGTMGLVLTLMRNGYLTLSLPEVTAERLERAGLLVSIAPTRAFSRAERRAIRDFVSDGGIFILTVGYDDSGPSRALLAELGFQVGSHAHEHEAGTAEPKPFGHFKSPYLDAGGYFVYIRFHAAWPVAATKPDSEVLAYGAGDVPVMLLRRIGDGKVVVVADSGFAMNKNLEREGGEPFEGLRENAHFWRWFLARLRGLHEWVPPNPQPEAPPPHPPHPPGAPHPPDAPPPDTTDPEEGQP